MKNTKILTVLAVLLAMGLTACGGNKTPAKSSSAGPSKTSQSSGGGNTSSGGGASSSSSSSSSGNPLFEEVADPDGHHFGAEEDVAADAEAGTLAYKKAACGDSDGFLKFRVNQSQVTFDGTSSNKSGTPEGYVKLNGNNESLSFKIKADKMYAGKLFLLGRMDGYSTEGNQTVGLYRQGSPNIKVEINGKAIDLSSKASYKYSDTFGTEYVETSLSSPSDKLSHEGYVEVGQVLLENGVNTFKYTRLASQNMIVRDFVFVVEEHTHAYPDTWTQAKAPTYTELGSETRKCSCGDVQQRDVNTLPFDIDETTEVIKLNGDSKKVYQYDYNSGAAKVAAVPMKEISAAYPTTAVEGEEEKWTLGDALQLTADKNAQGKAYDGSADGKLTVGDTYKLGKGVAIAFKVKVSAAISNAFLSIGAKYTNARARHFYNEGDLTQQDRNGDDPEADGYRYYTRVNDGNFQPIGFNSYMSEIFGDGSAVKYMPLGKFNLVEGENTIYIRQSNLGYRVTLEGNLYIALGSATVSGDSPAHAHQAATEWSKDETNHWHECVASGCDEPGIQMDKAAHTFGELQIVTPATCDADGVGKYVCDVCGYEKPAVIPAAHSFGAETDVEATDGKVGYKKSTCSACGAIQLRIRALDCTFTKGGNKTGNGAPEEGYMKLGTNEDQAKWVFDYAFSGENNVAAGKIYQLGYMDSYSNNLNKTYGYYSTSKNEGRAKGNFDLVLNGDEVDKSAYIEKTFKELTENGEEVFDSSKNYSKVALIPIGNVSLNNGTNTMTYTRTGSYNFAISELVIIVKESIHTHEAATEWSSDENTHWHACTDANCPVAGWKDSEAAHDWVADTSKTNVPATCEAPGVNYEKCSVCNREREVPVAALGHDFEVGEADANGISALTCKRDGCTASGIQFDGFTGDNASAIDGDNKVTKKFAFKWNVTMPKAGKVALLMSFAYSAGNGGQKFGTGYAIKVGETTGTITLGDVAFNTLLKESPTCTFVQIGTVDVTAGEIEIDYTHGNQGTRLISDKLVRLVYVD